MSDNLDDLIPPLSDAVMEARIPVINATEQMLVTLREYNRHGEGVHVDFVVQGNGTPYWHLHAAIERACVLLWSQPRFVEVGRDNVTYSTVLRVAIESGITLRSAVLYLATEGEA